MLMPGAITIRIPKKVECPWSLLLLTRNKSLAGVIATLQLSLQPIPLKSENVSILPVKSRPRGPILTEYYNRVTLSKATSFILVLHPNMDTQESSLLWMTQHGMTPVVFSKLIHETFTQQRLLKMTSFKLYGILVHLKSSLPILLTLFVDTTNQPCHCNSMVSLWELWPEALVSGLNKTLLFAVANWLIF